MWCWCCIFCQISKSLQKYIVYINSTYCRWDVLNKTGQTVKKEAHLKPDTWVGGRVLIWGDRKKVECQCTYLLFWESPHLDLCSTDCSLAGADLLPDGRNRRPQNLRNIPRMYSLHWSSAWLLHVKAFGTLLKWLDYWEHPHTFEVCGCMITLLFFWFFNMNYLNML